MGIKSYTFELSTYSFTLYLNEESARAEFWAIVSGIFLSSSLLVYLPLKLFSVKFLGRARQERGW